MRWIAFCLVVLFFGINHTEGMGADVAERFRSEAPIGWSAHRQFADCSQGTVRAVATPQAGAQPNSKSFEVLYRWNSCAGNERFEEEYLESPLKGTVRAIFANQHYGGVVHRRAKEQAFTLKEFGRNPQKTRDQADAERLQAFGLKVDAESADGIVLDPSFTALNVQSKHDGDEELITVDFKSDVKHRSDYNVKSGQIAFSPSKKWAVVSYVLRIQFHDAPGIARGTSEYASQTIDGIPIITKHTTVRTDITETIPYLRMTLDYSGIARGTATAEECSLPAFGLPEITNSETAFSMKIVFTCIGAGIVFILLAVALRARRAATP